jgi:hypothetical protein
MKTLLLALPLAFLSVACGNVETDREGSYRFKGSNVEYCLKADWGGCVTENGERTDKKEPECPKKAKPEVIVFDESEADEETEECTK